MQQLRDGVNNFFVTLIRVLEAGGSAFEVEPGVTAGDYLDGFLLGTRAALFENDRESMTATIPRVDARTVGGLIALFERAVGLYASLIGINAYNQPGVEAGKKGGRWCWPCNASCLPPSRTRRRPPSSSPRRPAPPTRPRRPSGCWST